MRMASQGSQVAVPEKFQKPFHKLTLGQLALARRQGAEWEVELAGPAGVRVPLHMVWIQAEVETVDRAADLLTVQEGGRRARVAGLRGLPVAADWVRAGQYVQVIGQFRGLEQGEPQVEGKTLRDLSSCRVARDLWPLEVAELHGLLAEQITVLAQH